MIQKIYIWKFKLLIIVNNKILDIMMQLITNLLYNHILHNSLLIHYNLKYIVQKRSSKKKRKKIQPKKHPKEPKHRMNRSDISYQNSYQNTEEMSNSTNPYRTWNSNYYRIPYHAVYNVVTSCKLPHQPQAPKLPADRKPLRRTSYTMNSEVQDSVILGTYHDIQSNSDIISGTSQYLNGNKQFVRSK